MNSNLLTFGIVHARTMVKAPAPSIEIGIHAHLERQAALLSQPGPIQLMMVDVSSMDVISKPVDVI